MNIQSQLLIQSLYFVSGLAFFSLGLSALLETRHVSEIHLGSQLVWLAAFGLARCTVDWSDLFLFNNPVSPLRGSLEAMRALLLPLSALLLVRFGIGLVGERGPLPAWLDLVPSVLLVPAALVIAYALIVAVTNPPLERAADVWSRYLLYLPGCLLAAFGFFRQWRGLTDPDLAQARQPMLGAAIGFLADGVADGLLVAPAPYGFAPWLNIDRVLNFTGIPAEAWRFVPALFIGGFAIRALGIFEAENAQKLQTLQRDREAAQSQALQAQLEARARAELWNNSLVGISRRVANLEPVDQVLAGIVHLARDLLQSDTAALGLWDASRSELELKSYASSAGAQTARVIPVRNPMIVDTVRACRRARFPEDLPPSALPWVCPVINTEMRAAAIVPLELEGKPVGGLWAARGGPNSFAPEDLSGLERLADQAVIAIQHSDMAARLQSLAVLEERSRIAREMHDGLSQILGYLNLEMQTLGALVQQNKCSETIAAISRARERITQAQADVRENILSLRTNLAAEEGVISALQEYVQEFGVQTGIEVEFTNTTDGLPALSPLAELQLIRIVQEALANVRKHSKTSEVFVHFEEGGGCLHAVVLDKGLGFDSQLGRTKFGLQTMKERAESVGGSMIVNSQRGAGTRVEVWLPLLDHKGAAP